MLCWHLSRTWHKHGNVIYVCFLVKECNICLVTSHNQVFFFFDKIHIINQVIGQLPPSVHPLSFIIYGLFYVHIHTFLFTHTLSKETKTPFPLNPPNLCLSLCSLAYAHTRHCTHKQWWRGAPETHSDAEPPPDAGTRRGRRHRSTSRPRRSPPEQALSLRHRYDNNQYRKN